MEEESTAVKLALESHILFIFVCAVQEKRFNDSKTIISIFFGTTVMLLTLYSVVSWSLMMH